MRTALSAPAVVSLALVVAGCKAKASPEAVATGRDLFAATCAKCHGADGSGGVAAADGQPAPRNLRDHGFQASRSDGQLRATIVSGKGSAMPPFGNVFDDKQLTGLVAFVRTLDQDSP